MICLSLANCCFIRVWGNVLLFRDPPVWLKTIPGPLDEAAVMTAVLLLGALLFGALRLARRHLPDRGFRVARFLSFALLAVPINGQRETVKTLWLSLRSALFGPAGRGAGLVLLALALAAVLWFAWKRERMIAVTLGRVLLALSPFCLLTFGEAAWAMASYHGQPFSDGPLAPRLDSAPPLRVVWIIYDEWDYRLSFVDRSANLAMPEIDRLRGESLFAAAARPPGADTDVSLPSFLTGRRLLAFKDASGGGVLTRPPDDRRAAGTPWTERGTVFSAVRESGFNVGLVGWFLPYCRVMNGDLSECAWWPVPFQGNSTTDSVLAGILGTGFWGRVGGYSASLLETYGWRTPLGQSSPVRQKARIYPEILAASRKDVADPSLGLVFLHVPVPHAPHPYSRFTGRMDRTGGPMDGYIDSLALLDRMMGDLRTTMERAGVWDRSVLLISADHPFRSSRELDGKSDWRVPFLLRIPGPQAAGVISTEFNTIVTANLICAILRGQVPTAPDAAAWIERHHADRESPVETRD